MCCEFILLSGKYWRFVNSFINVKYTNHPVADWSIDGIWKRWQRFTDGNLAIRTVFVLLYVVQHPHFKVDTFSQLLFNTAAFCDPQSSILCHRFTICIYFTSTAFHYIMLRIHNIRHLVVQYIDYKLLVLTCYAMHIQRVAFYNCVIYLNMLLVIWNTTLIIFQCRIILLDSKLYFILFLSKKRVVALYAGLIVFTTF